VESWQIGAIGEPEKLSRRGSGVKNSRLRARAWRNW
jgi:hypothetical protein